MKKFFTLLAALVMTMGAFATDYTDQLQVTVNGVAADPQPTTIIVNKNDDGTYNFELKDFAFQGLTIGDINMANVPAVSQNGFVYLDGTQTVHVNLGGAMPMDLPVTLRAELRDNETKMYASMDITVAMLGQDVNVVFGSGYQIKNSGFEDYHKATIYDYKYDDDWNPIGIDSTAIVAQSDEPNAWHGFQSASGPLSSLAGAMVHNFQTTEHHSGKYSVKLKAISIFGIVANGTMTTGRMNAASATAADVTNNAWLDMDSTAVDGNGDPFYTEMNGLPDSLTVWVKYNQATPNAEHPYATVSAAITDGKYYQDPQDKEYSNVLATAKNNKIEATGNDWKRIVIPFTVQNKDVNGKALLVTISTNADAGAGSDGDSILVDDIALIYNEPANVKVDWGNPTGTVTADDITVTYDGAQGAKVVKSFKQNGNNVDATVTVYNGDLTKKVATETHTYNSVVTGINAIDISNVEPADAPVEIYNLNGQRVNNTQPGQVYIFKKGNKAVKVLK